MKKERKRLSAHTGITWRPSAYTAIVWRLIVLAIALWLGCMGVLTLAVARDMYFQLESQAWEYVHSSARITPAEEDALPGSLEAAMLSQLGYPYYSLNIQQLLPFVLPQTPDSYGSDDWFWGRWELIYGFESAVIYYDANGEPLVSSGDYLRFTYVSNEMWANGLLDPQGYAYIDLDTFPEGREFADSWISDFPIGDVGANYFLPLLRLTGYFEGTQFHPVLIDRVPKWSLSDYDSSLEYCNRVDNRAGLDWETILDHSSETDRELVTIYGWDVWGCQSDPWESFWNEDHVPLADLLHTHCTTNEDLSKQNLLESVIICGASHEDAYGEYTLALAVRCHPLLYAIYRLRWVYLTTYLAGTLLTWLLLRRIRRELIVPLRQANWMAAGNPELPGKRYAPRWQEPYELEGHVSRLLKTDHDNKTELQQLRIALVYAKNAEKNRRQLVSNITHELKTPLAVIHSYAEGLQAGIAGEDRDRYLNVIQEEAEKMDAMVLEMLDLSRLEAGKVRLNTESFSLLALAQTIAEKLTPMAQAKDLEIGYDYTEECRLTADRGRMGQVITNLMRNAIQYTAPGGSIRITVYEKRSTAHFYIENTCQPLSQEALDRVFSSFYQGDVSRKTNGTGLGLAIVKSIVELHRGSCTVENTQNGVRFGFTVPLS